MRINAAKPGNLTLLVRIICILLTKTQRGKAWKTFYW